MKSVTDTYATSAPITERLTGEGGKFQKQLESTSGGSEESVVKIDPVMLNFKEKLQVVKTTKRTDATSSGIGTRSAGDGGRTIRLNAVPM